MEKARKPKKLVLYFDQNALSEMAKLGINDKVDARYEKLFQVLHRAFLGGQLAVLRSIHHEAETSAARVLKEPIRERLAMISHVQLSHPLSIKEAQLSRAVRSWCGKAGAGPTINCSDAFEDDPDAAPGFFDINVNADWMFEGEPKRREELAVALDVFREQERKKKTTFVQLFRRELNAERQLVASARHVYHISAMADVSVERVREFIESEAFGDVPYVYLDVSLTCKLLTHHSNHRIGPGDVPDLEALAAYLPYCDAFMTDKRAAAIARAVGAHERYGCEVFDTGKAGLAAMIDFVERKSQG